VFKQIKIYVLQEAKNSGCKFQKYIYIILVHLHVTMPTQKKETIKVS